ncbi:hypothetical protein EF908_37080, partial [Streptomyces sp. WAC04770]
MPGAGTGAYEMPRTSDVEDTLGIPVVETVDHDEPVEPSRGPEAPGVAEGRRPYFLPSAGSDAGPELPLVPPYVRAEPQESPQPQPQDRAHRPDDHQSQSQSQSQSHGEDDGRASGCLLYTS